MPAKNQYKLPVLGALFILTGMLFLLNNYGILPEPIAEPLFSWQTLLIVFGLYQFSANHGLSGIVLIIVGIVFLSHEYFPQYGITFKAVFGIVIILAGVSILMRRKPKSSTATRSELTNPPESHEQTDNFDVSAVMGEAKRSYYSRSLRGGSVNCVMGSVELDLTAAQLAGRNAEIDIFIFMGRVEILVPSGWNVQIEVRPIAGEFTEKKRRDFVIQEPGYGNLIIRGTVIFGGGYVKYRQV